MSARAVTFGALLALASAAEAGKPFDIHGLIIGNEGARYLKGIATLDLAQQRGAIQLRSLGFYKNRPFFQIAFYNAGSEPINIGLEDIHVSVNGTMLRVFPVEELERQEKQKAWWKKFGTALLGGLAAGAAASERNYSHGTISGPYGSYSVHMSYPSLAGQLRADRIEARTEYNIAAIQYQLDRTVEIINDHVVQRTTVDPGSTYGGLIILDKLKKGDPPFDMRLNIDWNGERYPFAFVMQKPGRPVPPQYAAMLAANAKPRALSAAFAPQAAKVDGAASPSRVATSRLANGAILLRPGVYKIPARTRSGFCIQAPSNYIGTGSANSPSLSGGMPICTEEILLGE